MPTPQVQPFVPISGATQTVVVALTGAQVNLMNSAPQIILDAVPGHIIVPLRLLDAYIAGTTSYAGTFVNTWRWLLGTLPFGVTFGLMTNGATLADDVEYQANWEPTLIGPMAGLIPGIGQPLVLSNAADFTGSDGIASTVLNAGGAGYAHGDTFNVTGGGGTGGAGVVDTVVNGVFLITALDQSGGAGVNFFVVAGNQAAHFPPASTFTVSGSTGNDGTYTVVGTSVTGGNTEIITVQAIVSAVADGTITSADDGAVLTYHLTSSGTGYAPTTAAATTATSGGGDDNFTIDILTVGDGDGTLILVLDYRVYKATP